MGNSISSENSLERKADLEKPYTKETRSLCPVCFSTIKAQVIEENGKIFIEKECKEHGYFKDIYWSDASLFKRQLRYGVEGDPIDNPNTRSDDHCPRDCGLCEKHQTHTMLANIDLTNRCNLHCPICFANADSAGYVYEPTLEQVKEMLLMLRAQKPNPVWAVQFSGGEPTVSPHIFEAIKIAKQLGIAYVIVATNGVKIAEDIEFAKQLKRSGLTVAYLQFDGITPEPYMQARGFDALPVKMRAVENLREANIPTTLVPTVVKGVNDDQLGAIIDYGFRNLDTIKAVNFQPVSFTGRINAEELEKMRVTVSDVMRMVEDQTDGKIRRSDWMPIPAFAPLEMMMEKISKERRSKASTHMHCGAGLYLFEKNGEYIPMNRFIDIDSAREMILDELGSERRIMGDLRLKTSLVYKISKTINKKEAPEYFNYNELLTQALLNGLSEIPPTLKKKGLFVGCMHFMDPYNFDLERVERCCIHYATPDLRLIPFCSYNIFHRASVEEKYAIKAT
jgi:7,8-dihydro-6-hydroxymethylpterin dimethyltransferase